MSNLSEAAQSKTKTKKKAVISWSTPLWNSVVLIVPRRQIPVETLI